MKKELSKPSIQFIILGVLILNIFDLYLFIHQFLFVYTDSDQTILWHAAKDMIAGNFYEPAFYGQSYNTMLEALFALPFIKAGAFLPYAVILATLFFSYSVIWLFGYFFYKKANYLMAILCLALPIIMPSEFQVLIGIPRGFVPGLSLTLWGIYFFISNRRISNKVLSGFLITLGFVINPNTMVVMSAFGIWYLFKPITKKWNEIKWFAIGSLPAWFYKIYIIWFYTIHPNFNIHKFPNPFNYNFKTWKYVVSEVFYLFKGLFPIINNLGCLSIILLLVLVYIIYKKSDKRHEQFAAIAGLSFIIFSFGINKVADGTGSPFFAYARMFLGIPVLYLFFISILQNYSLIKTHYYAMIFVITGVFAYKSYALSDRINYIVKHNSGVVKVVKLKALCQSCDSLKDIMQQTNSDILVMASKRDEINYGCAALLSLKTIHPTYERRTWVYEQEMFVKRKSILVYSESYIPNAQKIMANYYVLNLNGKFSIEEWARLNGIELRSFIKK